MSRCERQRVGVLLSRQVHWRVWISPALKNPSLTPGHTGKRRGDRLKLLMRSLGGSAEVDPQSSKQAPRRDSEEEVKKREREAALISMHTTVYG